MRDGMQCRRRWFALRQARRRLRCRELGLEAAAKKADSRSGEERMRDKESVCQDVICEVEAEAEAEFGRVARGGSVER